jgi:hypothetical protein
LEPVNPLLKILRLFKVRERNFKQWLGQGNPCANAQVIEN